jgi:hypothetical protein
VRLEVRDLGCPNRRAASSSSRSYPRQPRVIPTATTPPNPPKRRSCAQNARLRVGASSDDDVSCFYRPQRLAGSVPVGREPVRARAAIGRRLTRAGITGALCSHPNPRTFLRRASWTTASPAPEREPESANEAENFRRCWHHFRLRDLTQFSRTSTDVQTGNILL